MRNATEAALDYLTGDGWANMSDGNVDSPTGWFALIDLTTDRDIMADILEEHDGEMPPAAWYIYGINGDGIITATSHGDDEHDGELPPSAWYIYGINGDGIVTATNHGDDEMAARRHYAELADAYAAW